MNTRTTRKTVTFTQPFRLGGVDGVQPPGTYEVDTDEEQIDSLTLLAWRRVATMIVLDRDGATRIYRIDPVDLDASLLRDAGLTCLPAQKAQRACDIGVDADEIAAEGAEQDRAEQGETRHDPARFALPHGLAI